MTDDSERIEATNLDRREWNAMDAEQQFQLAYALWSSTNSYERVMRAIPECADHGSLCTSHARQWVIDVTAERAALHSTITDLIADIIHMHAAVDDVITMIENEDDDHSGTDLNNYFTDLSRGELIALLRASISRPDKEVKHE